MHTHARMFYEYHRHVFVQVVQFSYIIQFGLKDDVHMSNKYEEMPIFHPA